jgi:hypothetical protein
MYGMETSDIASQKTFQNSTISEKRDIETCLGVGCTRANLEHYHDMSRDSAVGIATGYGLDDRGVGVRVPVGSRIFSSPRRPDRIWGPPSLLSNRYRGGGLSPGVKRQERDADQPPPANAEVKNMWIHTSTPPYAFMA